MAGFRDEDEDFADLLPPPTMTSSSYAFTSENDEEDMTADPWGDTTSSGSALYTPSPFTSAYEPPSPEQRSTLPPATPSSYDEPRGFTRESAPEPETPAYSRTASASYNYDSYQQEPTSPIAPTSPFQAPYSPPAAAEQTPFGSPPISPSRASASAYSPTSHTRQASKPDLSALLGEEKPILPKFTRRETPEGVAGPLGSKIAVLPVSSIGKKPVGGALATLLGLEVDEAEAKKEKERFEAGLKAKADAAKAAPPPAPAPAVKEEPKVDSKEVTETPSSAEEPIPIAAPAADSTPAAAESTSADVSVTETPAPEPLPPTPTTSEPIPPPVLVALSTPLPPSPSVSPPPPTDSNALTPQPPALSRTSSTAGSMLSVDSSQGNGVYDTIVSPMEAEGAAEAWPGEEGKGSVEGLEKKLEALKVDTSSTKDAEDASANASEPTPTESSGEHLPSSETATIAPTPSTPPASLPTAVNTGPDPFAQYTYSEAPSPALSSARPSFSEGPISPTTNRGFRSYNGSTDEGVFGGADDADSLRGTYSRSVEVSEGGEDASDAMDAERAGVTSPPLPPLPTMGSPSVGTSPRSTEIGGSLGPTFIISVGDPQKIGSSLNVAAQHTVYTVRTRVSFTFSHHSPPPLTDLFFPRRPPRKPSARTTSRSSVASATSSGCSTPSRSTIQESSSPACPRRTLLVSVDPSSPFSCSLTHRLSPRRPLRC